MLASIINDPPKERPWLRTIENDLKHQNLRLWSAWHRAYDRDQWRDIMETGRSCRSMLHDDYDG